MEQLPKLTATDLVEAYTPDQIEEMIERPSPLALERMQSIGLYANQYHKVSGKDGEPTMRDFLREQTYGYYDEMVAALHTPEDVFAGYISSLIERDPVEMAVNHAPVFDRFMTPEKKAQLVRVAASDSRELHRGVADIVENCDPDERATHSDRALEIWGNHIGALSLFPALVYSTRLTLEDKRRFFEKTLRTREFLFGDFRLGSKYETDTTNFIVHNKAGVQAVRYFKQMVEAGIVDLEKFEKELDARIAGTAAATKDHFSEQFREEALETKLELQLEGVLPLPAGKTFADVAFETVEWCLGSDWSDKTVSSSVSLVTPLVRNNLVDRQRIENLLKETDAKKGTKTYENLQHTLTSEVVIAYVEDSNLHSNNEKINEIYDNYIVTSDRSLHDIDNFKVYRAVLGYIGTEQEKARQIVEALAEITALTVDDRQFNDLARLFKGHENRLRMAYEKSMEINEEIGYFTKLKDWAEFMGYGAEELRQIAQMSLQNTWSVHTLFSSLQNYVESGTEIFSQAELVPLIVGLIKDRELQKIDIDRIIDFGYQVLGSRHMSELIGHLGEAAQPITQRLAYDTAATLAPFKSSEYYDIYDCAVSINTLVRYETPEVVKSFIEKVFTLGDEHFADVLGVVWDHFDLEQRQKALARIAANSLLAALELGGMGNTILARESGYDRMLPSKPHEDVLRALAPASADLVADRLRVKTYPEDNPVAYLERQHADQLFPEAIESGRRNALNHYAYPNALALRVHSVSGSVAAMEKFQADVKTIDKRVREKHELRNLELLTMLHEAADVTDFEVIATMSKEETERLALAGVVSKAGLSIPAADELYDYLALHGVDQVRFGMWLHTSFRSTKLATYLSPFVEQLSIGGSVADWKMRPEQRLLLPPTIDKTLAEKWVREESQPFTLLGRRPGKLRFTNNLSDLYLAGVQPIQNCLHYGFGSNQKALAGLLNTDVKLLAVDSKRGGQIANAVMRLTEKKNGEPLLLLEPLYTSEAAGTIRDELHVGVVAAAEAYAERLGVAFGVANIENHGKQMKRAARLLWSGGVMNSQSVILAQSLAPYTYNDTTGINTKKTYSHALTRS